MSARREKAKKRKKHIIIKILIIIILIMIIIVAGAGTGGYLYLKNKLDKINYVEIDEKEIEITEGVEEQLLGYRNIALFGVDSRSDSYGKGNRSDCIIIATINQDTKDIKLTSVYRDTYLQITGRSLDKVTHAYSYGGAALAMSTLNTNLDLNITEFVTVNFDSLVDIVDALGGVEVDVEKNEVEYLNSYLEETARVAGVTAKKVTKAGKQTLNGAQAVSYCRIRYTAGGDYKRTERMRTILTAIFTKAKSKNITELNKLADKILPKIYTNIESNEVLSLLPQVASYSMGESTGWPYETKGATINGVWYGVPVNLAENVKKLHQELFNDDNYEVSAKVKSISNSIISKTGYK